MSATVNNCSKTLVSLILSGILSLVIFGILCFGADWFNKSQINIMVGGFAASWLFILCLTFLSNVESLICGQDFQARFMPEIICCLLLSVTTAGIVHRVCATTCILFSLVGLYFINDIASKYHSNVGPPMDQLRRNKKVK